MAANWAAVYSPGQPDKRVWLTSNPKLCIEENLRTRKQLACRVSGLRPSAKALLANSLRH
jgi:hypothetical protein